MFPRENSCKNYFSSDLQDYSFFFFQVPFSLIEKKFKKQNKTKQVKDSSGQKPERIFTVLKRENSKFTPLGPKRHRLV